MNQGTLSPKKPKALVRGSRIAVFAPASPAETGRAQAGIVELRRLGFSVNEAPAQQSVGYFAASEKNRRGGLLNLLATTNVDGLVALRGGYGSNYLIDGLQDDKVSVPKGVIGYSDLTTIQIYLWQTRRWVTFYGPMVAAGLDAGTGRPTGYDEESFRLAVSKTDNGWTVQLRGESLVSGETEGRLLGGCLTLIETTLGTTWELETRDAILLLEDRGMKPWQVDRGLMHLKQAGKFEGVRGFVLGEFPECEPPMSGSPTVREVCVRILGGLGVPMVFGAPVGHTPRPMLTLPLGIKARLRSQGEGALEILEPAVVQ